MKNEKGAKFIMVTTPKTTSLHTLEEWKEIIEDWEKSGLTKHAYYKEKKIGRDTFYKWKRRVDLSFHKESYMKTFEEWESIIEDWQKSGLDKNAYCKKNNIEYFSFYAWEKKVNPSPSQKQLECLKKWEEIIEDWRKSNLRISDYCKKKKIKSKAFYTWKSKVSPSLHNESYLRVLKKWTPIIEDWQKSGLNRGAYCKEKKLTSSLFYMWEKRLNSSYKPTQERRLEKWTPIIEDWKKSGLNRSTYCIQNELTDSFYRWENLLNPSVSRKTTHQVALETWTPIIEDWKQSGLNRYVYCKKKRLANSCFYKWEKKLNPSRSSQPLSIPIEETQVETQVIPEPSLKDLFIPFGFLSSLSNNPAPTHPKIEVILAQGHRLSLEGSFDWEKLTSWLTPLLRK